MTSLFIFAGETSGDLHGGPLIDAIHSAIPSLSIWGVGGPRMRQNKFDCFIPMEEFQVMGFSDVVRALPRLWKLFFSIRNAILDKKPTAVLLIDYPGFNLRLAASLRKNGYKGKLIHYICPSVWAHGKKRIATLSSHYDLLLTIFPFEASYFSATELKVQYVGNPLVETISSHEYQKNWMDETGIPKGKDLIALFPGSRLSEIQKHVPQQLLVAEQLKKKYPHLHFALSCAHDELYQPLVQLVNESTLKLGQDLHITPPQSHYDLMQNCQTALAKSGTVTLELALHGVPSVVHYEVSPLNYCIAKYILRLHLPYYCIVNILANDSLFPEFIGRQFPLKSIEEALEASHLDPIYREKVLSSCNKLRDELGATSAHASAAKALQELLLC